MLVMTQTAWHTSLENIVVLIAHQFYSKFMLATAHILLSKKCI